MAQQRDNAEDAALLGRIRRREPAALRAAYDRHAPAVHSICLRLLRDPHEAEQVLVDVFAEIWDRPDRFDPTRGSLASFLAVIARSRSLDAARVRARDVRRSEAAVRLASDSAEAAADEPSLRAEERAAVASALGVLSPEQRDAVRLAFYDGLSHAEIAGRLGRPLGTVKTQVRQGLLRMRDALRGYWEGGRGRP